MNSRQGVFELKNRWVQNSWVVDKINYSDDFEKFWELYPSAKSWDKNKSYEYYKNHKPEDVLFAVNILNRQIEFGLINTQYLRLCENWLKWFSKTTWPLKEQQIRDIVTRHMEYQWEGKKENAQRLYKDFWRMKVGEYAKNWSNEKNKITLNLK
jgi:hypothetical protein